jgi:saccharopine dehydrogenase-like NADP-dependent oxidoreductase
VKNSNKKVLVLGLGLQGRAVVHDLEKNPMVAEIIGADLHVDTFSDWLTQLGCHKTRCEVLNCTNQLHLVEFIKKNQVDVVVCMVPPTIAIHVAKACIDSRVPFVSSSYTNDLESLDEEARVKGVTILPEMGFDPGIDLIMARQAVAEFDEVHGMYSYGAGFPDKDACNNPLKYKITWTYEGVLRAYTRDYRLLVDGEEIFGDGSRLFHSPYIHSVDVPGLGCMEAYPNGDAVHFAKLFGLGEHLSHMGRFVVRWPGHCSTWRLFADLGFLSDKPLEINGASISPRAFLARHLSPQLQFAENERDVALIMVDTWGMKDGEKKRVIYRLIDYRDLETGLFAMNRTVGYTASIATQMVLAGEISAAGVLSPIDHVPADKLFTELKKRGIEVSRSLADPQSCLVFDRKKTG